MHVSPSIKDKRRDEVVAAVHASLLPGEQPLAVFAINRVRRAADYLALTDHRVLTWSRPPGMRAELVDDIDGTAITDVAVKHESSKSGKAEIMTAGGKVFLGTFMRTTADELRYVEQTLRYLMNAAPTDEMRARRYTDLASQIGAREAALVTATTQQRRELAKELDREADEAVLRGVQLFGDGKVTKPMLRTIREVSHGEERPWLVLVSSGAGALIAFEDRAVLMKVGAYTAMMAGSMGGGRVATFHFTDITGIEYNSGMLNGVLEILTPSYQGTANKDFWRGTHRSRNADANDPFTLSNTLPLAKYTYQAALPGLNELRARIGRAKQPHIVIAPPPGTTAPAPSLPPPTTTPAVDAPPPPTVDAPAGSVTDELERLADLHSRGVLTDEEFAAAKAALIARM